MGAQRDFGSALSGEEKTCEIYFERLGMGGTCKALTREEMSEVSQMHGERAQRYALFISCEELRRAGEALKEEGKLTLPFDITEMLNPADVNAAYEEICRMSGWGAEAQIVVKRNYESGAGSGDDDGEEASPDGDNFGDIGGDRAAEGVAEAHIGGATNGTYEVGRETDEPERAADMRERMASTQVAVHTERAQESAESDMGNEYSNDETTAATVDMEAMCEYFVKRVIAAAENM